MIFIALYFSPIYPFGLAYYIDLSLAGEVLCNGFNLAVFYIPVTERDKIRIFIVAIKAKMTGFIHIDWVYFVYIMSSCLKRYSICHELNTIYACWIAVDWWSNSSRCRQESVYLSRT